MKRWKLRQKRPRRPRFMATSSTRNLTPNVDNIIFIESTTYETFGSIHPSPIGPSTLKKYQPALRRELNRRSPWRQNSNRWGFATGSSSSFSCGLTSDLGRGSAASAINSSPYSRNQADRSASALSSTHWSTSLKRSLRLFADLLSCARWNCCKRICEISSRYASGGSRIGGSGFDTCPPLDYRGQAHDTRIFAGV